MYRRDDVAGTLRWYLMDGLGSVVGEVDPSGNLTCSRGFDVYGATRSQTGTPTSKHGFVGKLGHPTEDESGLVYMRARWYDSACGRFISQDPAKHGVNRFAYAHCNPVGRLDPSGLDDLCELMITQGAQSGLDGSLDGLGLSELEGFTTNNSNTLNVMILEIQNAGGIGSQTFQKQIFLRILSDAASRLGLGGVEITGQTMGNPLGQAMFRHFAEIAIEMMGDDAVAAGTAGEGSVVAWSL